MSLYTPIKLRTNEAEKSWNTKQTPSTTNSLVFIKKSVLSLQIAKEVLLKITDQNNASVVAFG